MFGLVIFEINFEGGISKIIWIKLVENVLVVDDYYYKLSFWVILLDVSFIVVVLLIM